MIILYNGYVLSNDSIQWILQKENGINKKTGKMRYKPIGYFTRLENALSEFGRKIPATHWKMVLSRWNKP